MRVPRARLHELPAILRAIPPARVVQMQATLARVWERFTFSSLAIAERDRRCAEDAGGRDCTALRAGTIGERGEATGRRNSGA